MNSPVTSSDFPPMADVVFDPDLDEHSFARIAEVVSRYGDIVGLEPERRNSPSVLLNHPDLVGQVLGAGYTNYVKGVGKQRVRLLLGNGLIVASGEPWQNHRRMLQAGFRRDRIADFATIMTKRNLELLERWRERATSNEPIDVKTDLARLTLEIIVYCLFGEDAERLVSSEGDLPFDFLAEEQSRSLRTVQLFSRPRAIIREVIERRRRAERQHQDDLIGVFMAARHPETGQPMTDKQLTDEVTTMVVAGHETSAAALGWAWYLISQNPAVEADLHREVDALESNGCPGFPDLADLVVARRILEETLRLYPPGWLLTRRSIEAARIGRYTIPPDTDVLISPYFLHRRPDFWPEPERFDPSRFRDRKERHRFAYIPFGAGPRRCIGDVFALVEMQIHLALMARHFRLDYTGDTPPTIEPRVNLRSKGPLLFRAESRG